MNDFIFKLWVSNWGISSKVSFHHDEHSKTLKSLEVQCLYLRAGVKKDFLAEKTRETESGSSHLGGSAYRQLSALTSAALSLCSVGFTNSQDVEVTPQKKNHAC